VSDPFVVVLLLAGFFWLGRQGKRNRRDIEELRRTTDAAWKAIEQLSRESGSSIRRRAPRAWPSKTLAAAPSPAPAAASAGDGTEWAVASLPDEVEPAGAVDAAPDPEATEPAAVALPEPTRISSSPAVEASSRPPIAAGAPPRPVTPRPGARSHGSFERLVGMFGTAIVAGVAFVFFIFTGLKAAIDRGWLTPELRIVFGLIAGISALIGSEPLSKRKLTAGANALAGSGAAMLYAVAWAGYRLFHLFGLPWAFGLMVGVTLVSGLLSVRRESLVIAVLGLLGGFATPLVLSTGEDHPIGLFSYVLLLDFGMLAVALKQRWPGLGLLGVVATVVIEAAWLLAKFTPESFLLALGIFALFGVLFAVLGVRIEEADRRHWQMAQALGAAAPFVFGAYVAQRFESVAPLLPLAAFATLLSLASQVLARSHRQPMLATLGVAGLLTILAIWVGKAGEPASLGPVALAWIAIGALHHLLLEWEVRGGRPAPNSVPSVPLVVIGLMVLALGVLRWHAAIQPWPVPLVAWALGALVLRETRIADKSWIGIVGALAVVALLAGRAADAIGPRPASGELALLVATAVAAQIGALAGSRRGTWLAGEWSAVVVPVAINVPLAVLVGYGPLHEEPAIVMGTALVLGVLALLAAARAEQGAWLLAAMWSVALVHASWQLRPHGDDTPWLGLPFDAAAVVAFAAWPFLAGRRFASSDAAWRVAAIAPVVWLPIARAGWLDTWGDRAIGLLPLLLALPSILGAARARSFFAGDDARRRFALAWFAAVALGLVSVAIPMQLDHEWITIGWAVEGLALVVLFERLDQVGLKYVAMGFFTTIVVRLCMNPAVLEYHTRGGLPVLNWLLYTYVIPAAALIESARRLAPIEVPRWRPWEKQLFPRTPRPWFAGSLGLAAVVVVFVWINLTIADAFGTGARLEIELSRAAQARNLTTSVAWALYAVVLLAIGVARKVVPLRWVALVVLFVAVNKVFLFDLGSLTGLYRALSFLGLGVGLLLVSLVYQRFVYRGEEK